MNCKYTIEWQYYRLLLKQEKDLNKKLEMAEEYFNIFLDKKSDSVYSVLNWLGGLSLGYKDRTTILNLYNKLSQVELKNLKKEELSSVEDIIKFNGDFDVYKLILKDNLNREIKWLSKFYLHKDLDQFVNNLYTVVKDCDKLFNKKELLKKEALGHKSEWKFFF